MTASTTKIETPYHLLQLYLLRIGIALHSLQDWKQQEKIESFWKKPTKIPKKRQSFDRQDLSCFFCLIQALARANSPLISNPTTKKKHKFGSRSSLNPLLPTLNSSRKRLSVYSAPSVVAAPLR
jgi:hypothetical protein